MSTPPALYWQEKANLCERAFIQQIHEGDSKEAIKNLFRMSYALNMRDAMKERESEICLICGDNYPENGLIVCNYCKEKEEDK